MRPKQLQDDELNAEEAFKRLEGIKSRELFRRKLLLENVKDLCIAYDKQDYRVILGEVGTWSGYLGQVEVFYSRAEVERLRRVYTALMNLGFAETAILDFMDIPDSRLQDIAAVATTQDQANELADQARVLIPSDWRDLISKLKGKPTSDQCPHSYKLYQICGRCGKRHEQSV